MLKKWNQIFNIATRILVLLCISLLFIVFVIFHLTFLARIFFIFTVFLIFMNLINVFQLYRISKFLKLKELKQIVNELKRPLIDSSFRYIVTEHYIIKKSIFIDLIKIEDIVLMYQSNIYNFKNFRVMKILITKCGKKHKLLTGYSKFPYSEQVEDDLRNILQFLNHNILFGKTKENVDFVNQKYGIKL